MQHVFNKTFSLYKNQLSNFINHFDNEGEAFGNGDRNTIKLITINNLKLNVKSFKTPNIFNQIAYKFFRKNKAQRSFEYANKLLQLGVGTPQPIAYYAFTTPFLFKKSFYISEHLECDLTYRELVENPAFKNHEQILRAFTQFTFQLHEKEILFKDHSPGNTLIKIKDDGYEFYIVDLNRMEFKPLDFENRINNFARLTPKKEMVKVMANEYAKLINVEESKIFDKMWSATKTFQKKYHDKIALKKKLFFWKKKYRTA